MTIKNLTISALFIALGIILPFFTAQIPQLGNMLLPMHIPVLLAGMILPLPYASLVGFVIPLLRSALFSMPPMFPSAFAMAFELTTYALVINLIYNHFKNKDIKTIYVSLIGSMLAGRIVWGIVMYIITKISFNAFLASAFINAIPGIILQFILIPLLILSLNKFIN